MRYAIIIAAMLLAVSCGPRKTDYADSGPSNSSTVAGTSGASATTETSFVAPVIPQELDNPAGRATPAQPVHEVHLVEYDIHMPQSVPAGNVTFNVENAGKEDHAFEVEGNGVHRQTQVLPRGNTTTLQVNLPPGTYTVYCPVADHADKGMKNKLVVR